jgi:hypothetical protein
MIFLLLLGGTRWLVLNKCIVFFFIASCHLESFRASVSVSGSPIEESIP